MENVIKWSHPKMTGQNDRQDESLTGRYFERCKTIESELQSCVCLY